MDRAEATRALELLRTIVSQTRDDTALQNWGIIWMLHAVTAGAGFIATDVLLWAGIQNVWIYALLWMFIVAFNITSIFLLKASRTGARSFVETQIWAIWLTHIAAVVLLAAVNHVLGLPIFHLGPVIPVLAAVAMSSMGSLMGRKYFVGAAVFAATALLMALFPRIQFVILGLVWGGVQFWGGRALHRERNRRLAVERVAKLV